MKRPFTRRFVAPRPGGRRINNGCRQYYAVWGREGSEEVFDTILPLPELLDKECPREGIRRVLGLADDIILEVQPLP